MIFYILSFFVKLTEYNLHRHKQYKHLSIYFVYVYQMENLIKDFCFYQKYTLNRTDDVVNHHYYNIKQFVEYVKSYKGMLIKQEDINLKDCLDFLSHYRQSKIQN